MILTIIIVLISIVLLADYRIKKRRYDMTNDIPGPTVLPIVGSGRIFQQRNMEDAMKMLEQFTNDYGPFTRVWIFNKLAILSSCPKSLEIILSNTKHISKNSLYNFLASWLGNGLLLSTGSKWHSRRKIITPTFHFKILEEFVEIFDQQSRILVERLRRHCDEKEFNIYPYVTLAALDVVSETAMGTKINAQTDPNCEYVRAVAKVTEILTRKFVNVWFRNDFIFKIFRSNLKREQDCAIKVLHDFTEKIIEDRRESLMAEQKDKTEEIPDEVGSKKKLALLDVLLQSTINGQPLTNADIREEVDTFMFEGHDTTTSAICFALYCISRHPQVQQKIISEIREVIGEDRTKPITYRELQDLKYLEYTIKESLRLYPPVPVIGRKLTEDTLINGYTIPAESNFTIPIYIMGRNPELFPEPEVFRPERHTLENTTEKTNPYAYIPFSAGPRNCIGQKFAVLEMKSTISKILRNYELLPLGPDPKPVLNLVLRSINGIHVGIKERSY